MNGQFSCSDKETLVGYIYGECDAAARQAVEAHLSRCEACAGQVAGFGEVREALAEWAPPATAGGFRLVREEERAASAPAPVLRPARWWKRPLPALARAAAAILLFAGGAALANLDVHYGADGLTVRTGWQHAAPVAAGQAASQSAAATPASAPVQAPWRSDLVALERQLRGDFSAQLAAARAASAQAVASPGADDRQVMSRVRSLIDTSIGESEQRQRREVAYQLAQMQGEFGAQRRADLVRLQQGLGWVQGQTGAEVAQQRQLINYLLTVSQKK